MKNNRVLDPLFWEDERKDRNCGSYALGLDSWFTSYEDEEFGTGGRDGFIIELFENGYDINSIMDILLESDEEKILEKCPWVRKIRKEDIADEVAEFMNQYTTLDYAFSDREAYQYHKL